MCVGVPAQVVDLQPNRAHSATVEVEGVRRIVNTILVDEDGLELGQWVLLHVGFAMSKLDEEQAHQTLVYLRQLGSAYDDELAAFEDGEA